MHGKNFKEIKFPLQFFYFILNFNETPILLVICYIYKWKQKLTPAPNTMFKYLSPRALLCTDVEVQITDIPLILL